MAVRTEPFPSHLLRLFMTPIALGAVLTALLSTLERRARRPSLPKMSDEWLKSYSGRRDG